MRNNRPKKSLFPIILIAVVAYLIFLPEEEKPTHPVKNSPAPLQGKTVIEGSEAFEKTGNTPTPSYASTPLQNTWPGGEENEADILTASRDLMSKNYYLILDASGSMMEDTCSSGHSSKMQSAIKALDYFASQLPETANFGLAIFLYGELKELLPLGKNNRNNIDELLSRIIPSGGTPLDQAITFGYQKLFAQGKRQQGYGEYNLVIITDGLASGGHDPKHAVEQILNESPVAIHTIGFCIKENHALNRPGLTVYRSANDPESLKQGLVKVLAESPEFDLTNFKE